MVKSMQRKLVVGLEIGTTKITVLVGEILLDDKINIIGVGTCISEGINKGDVNDLNAAVKCVQNAIHQAELVADCHISSVYLSLSSKDIYCQNEIGMISISDEEITSEDINNVIHTARSVRINHNHRILHVIPQEYIVDHQKEIKNPIGLSGMRMQAKVHLITCHDDIIKKIIKVTERCSIKVDEIICASLASSFSILTNDERALGVCLVDFGGGTIDLALYVKGFLYHTKVIPYAGNMVTHDIAYAFGISFMDAELIKIRHGAINVFSDCEETISIEGINGRQSKIVEKKILSEVIEARYNELLRLVYEEILYVQKKYQLSGGIVLTGGASKIEGLALFAQNIFNTCVRIGKPLNINGLIKDIDEKFSTSIGLLQYGNKLCINRKIEKKSFIKIWINRIHSWFKKEF